MMIMMMLMKYKRPVTFFVYEMKHKYLIIIYPFHLSSLSFALYHPLYPSLRCASPAPFVLPVLAVFCFFTGLIADEEPSPSVLSKLRRVGPNGFVEEEEDVMLESLSCFCCCRAACLFWRLAAQAAPPASSSSSLSSSSSSSSSSSLSSERN